jgi:hypothetical protein
VSELSYKKEGPTARWVAKGRLLSKSEESAVPGAIGRGRRASEQRAHGGAPCHRRATRRRPLGEKLWREPWIAALWAVLLAVSYTRTANAFRTAGESAEIQSAAPVRWQFGQYRFALNSQLASSYRVGDYETTVVEAINAWAVPVCSALSVSYLGRTELPAKPGDGINTVQWVSAGWVSRGFDPAVPAFADVNYERQPDGSWLITEADVYINGENNAWALSDSPNASQLVLKNIMLHEFGHAIGLEHPCDDIATTGLPLCSSDASFGFVVMNPVYSSARTALSIDDAAGVCWLYSAAGACGEYGCDALSVCEADGCHEPCGSVLCAVGQSCALGICIDKTIQKAGDSALSGSTVDLRENCSATSSCRRGLSCKDGTCRGGARLFGDPCDSDSLCASGICSLQGYCAEPCKASSDCTESGVTCADVLENYGECVSALAPMGASCASSVDCAGNQCLSEDGRPSICTRLCETDGSASCPAGWYCNEYDGRKVCSTSGPRDTGCGCFLVGHEGRSSGPLGLVAFGLLALTTRRRRRLTRSLTKNGTRVNS